MTNIKCLKCTCIQIYNIEDKKNHCLIYTGSNLTCRFEPGENYNKKRKQNNATPIQQTKQRLA